MTRTELIHQIRSKKSFLCIGLDTDLEKIPPHLLKEEDPIFSFNKAIIDATHDLAVAYKPNIAFYERLGPKGWLSLEKTLDYIPKELFTIADAKRGDIGNTSSYYAKAFFEAMDFDSITIAPYMGSDSVEPFLQFEGKWAILLALTSNKGALDFQMIENENGKLYEQVIKKSSEWGSPEKLMFVVGATRGDQLRAARKAAPNNFFLIPGVGAQGGSLKDVCDYALNQDIGVLVNSSRAILYTDKTASFANSARSAAMELQQNMKSELEARNLI
jgi:orotidine-5'-phosphate decarboxylase